jgi:hypothetical protein
MTQNIFLVKKLPIPEEIARLVEPNWADDSKGLPDGKKGEKGDGGAVEDPLSTMGRLLTSEQRVLVMEKVRDGKVTLDEAIDVVLKAEEEIRAAERGQVVCLSYRDRELNSTHVIALLSKGGRTLETILETIAKVSCVCALACYAAVLFNYVLSPLILAHTFSHTHTHTHTHTPSLPDALSHSLVHPGAQERQAKGHRSVRATRTWGLHTIDDP